MSSWDLYLDFNDAIAEVVYPSSLAAKPAYLDLEDDVLDRIGGRLGIAPGLTPGQLAAAVKETFQLGQGPSAVLREHWVRVRRWWKSSQLDPPPTLALLASLSLAAEMMQNGDGFSANNFYGRYGDLMTLTDSEREDFIKAYRKQAEGYATSEWFWGTLNQWLERLEGNQGLPTAFAESLTHVGLPLSQAIVRQTDRRRLPNLFASYGVAPHTNLHPLEMLDLVGEWISREPCPLSNNFKRIWLSGNEARERIAEVVCGDLSAWDGSGVTEAQVGSFTRRGIGSIRVKASLVRFPAPHIEIGFLVSRSLASESVEMELLGPDQVPLAVLDFVQTSPGWITLADPNSIDVGSFLNAHTFFRNEQLGIAVERLPRRLIPLIKDNLAMTFVEQERSGLGQDSMILVHNDLTPQVIELLSVAARPGFRRIDALRGLPEGWTLFDGVQILSSVPDDFLKTRRVDLNVLQPIATSLTDFEGGMKLPGNIQKFSTFRPPELRVTSQGVFEIHAQLTSRAQRSGEIPVQRQIMVDQPVLVWNIQELGLPDGDYQVEVSDGEEKIGQTRTLRLRTADTPAVTVGTDRDELIRYTFDPMSVLSAQILELKTGFQIAPDAISSLDDAHVAKTSVPSWFSARQVRPRQSAPEPTIHFPTPSADSCMVTGHHYMLLPIGEQGQSSVAGVCKGCGLVKRYSLKPKYGRVSKKNISAKRIAPRITVSSISPVAAPLEVDWQIGFDALCHIGAGSFGALQQVAMQMVPTSLFVDTFTRTLEALGHIEVQRDHLTLSPKNWEVCDPTFVGLSDGRYILNGFRSPSGIAELLACANDLDVQVDMKEFPRAPQRIRLSGTDDESLQMLVQVLGEQSGRRVRIVQNAAESLANSLPPLSGVIEQLPRTSAISGKKVERWDSETARFEPTNSTTSVGAYRLQGFARSYIYRRSDDLGLMSARIGDARLVKFAAALDSGNPLVGYDEEFEVLYTPLGAELPGLFGRAAELASGTPPRENEEEHLLEYRDVPARLAAKLMKLLMT